MSELASADQPDAAKSASHETADVWRQQAVDYGRIMSQVKWTPVADGMPKRKGFFEKGREYTGVPYSSVKSVGRYIGYDIFLKTFLAAVENPESVLYTENLYGEVSNAECYYGKVCSSYTSYALQCGVWYISRVHGPKFRDGVTLVEPQSALFAEVGDVIYTPPARKGGGSHIELVTGITRDSDGKVSHVRVEESWPETTRETSRDVAGFDAHIGARDRELYRITDLDAWREGNRADAFLFPNYEEDAVVPDINRVLLLDRGDWVPYQKGQAVKINIMDRDAQGVKALVVKRAHEVVELIERPGRGVIELAFSTCGDYTAHCVMNDGSLSPVCEFSVCDLDFSLPEEGITMGEAWAVDIDSENMKPIILYFHSSTNAYTQHNVFVTERDRKAGKISIPADLVHDRGKMEVWLIGENRYGRLKQRRDMVVR